MSKEIERKYLVTKDSYKAQATEIHAIEQGYLSTDADATVRVRVCDGAGYITVKTRNYGAVRNEWEYEIPLADARQMLEHCRGGMIVKTRYVVPFAGYKWEVDVFAGANAGLVVAEIELPDEQASFALPDFVGAEVTGDKRYYNSVLSQNGIS